MIVKKLLLHQSAFIQAPEVFPQIRMFFLIAGYGAGKTSALVDLTLKTVLNLKGKVDREGKPPKILLCGITLTFLKKTFAGSFISALRQTKSEYHYDKAHNIIYVCGVEIYLTPISEEENIFGYDCTAVIVDELDELPTYKAVAVVKSLGDRARQVIPDARLPFLAFATTSQGLKGTYQLVQMFRRKGIGYVLIRGRTKDNIYLPKEYVDAQYRTYNEKETRCLLDAEFISIDSGLVYPDYDPATNRLEQDVYKTVKSEETIYIGQDFNIGFNKAVALVVRDGTIFAIKEYSFPDIRRAPEVFRYDFPYNVIKWIPDATYNAHLPEFKRELRASKINIVYRKTNPLVKDRSFLINKLFYTKKMFISSDCKELDNALVIRQVDKVTGAPAKGKGESAPDHITDPLEYACSYCTSWLKELKDLYKITLGRRIIKRIEAGLTSEDDETYNEEVGNSAFE